MCCQTRPCRRIIYTPSLATFASFRFIPPETTDRTHGRPDRAHTIPLFLRDTTTAVEPNLLIPCRICSITDLLRWMG
jgi:hypothetical protein